MTRQEIAACVANAQSVLTENARALARLALRAEDDTRPVLSQLRDSTAEAVKDLERARLALLVAQTGTFERVRVEGDKLLPKKR